ncbi:hypothetical protein [Pedobacter sp. V48]|uniref:hypothetical protein n=1 Tax=Pedobacter sp. V48 TaxID=509635 RepID=UPI0003E50583|nr:hypothetical protein [Pedobacter sp. V48]ETZ22829.1 hypothetical protein N824_21305 [Pedobacter sp. V48]
MKINDSILNLYTRPFLVATQITLQAKEKTIELFDDNRSLKIDIDGEVELGYKLIKRLTDPGDGIWHLDELKNNDIIDLITYLDRYGWIQDADKSGEIEYQRLSKIYLQVMTDANSWMLDTVKTLNSIDEEKSTRLKKLTYFYFTECNNLISSLKHGHRSYQCLSDIIISEEDSMELLALNVSLRAWQHTSPKTLYLISKVLTNTIENIYEDKNNLLNDDKSIFELTGTEDVLAIKNQVWAFCCLMVKSIEMERKPMFRKFTPKEMNSTSGINAIIQAEAIGESLMNAIENTELLDVINGSVYAHRSAVGVFLHQHFVTITYIDAILSFLRPQLNRKTKIIGFDYLLEEIGHDAHEREACILLGLTEEQIDTFAPLPFFTVYADIIGYLSEKSPLTFCMAILVAEGMPGEKKKIADALANQGIDHEELAVHTELDLSLNHTYYPRKMMSSFPWISGQNRVDATRNFLFILELSQLCWKQLARYAANEKLNDVPLAFKIPFSELRKL